MAYVAIYLHGGRLSELDTLRGETLVTTTDSAAAFPYAPALGY